LIPLAIGDKLSAIDNRHLLQRAATRPAGTAEIGAPETGRDADRKGWSG
jgi:hypothetical protein